MNIPRLFKLPEHRKFSYRPFYYSPEKEERESRLRDLKIEAGIKTEEQYASRIHRGSMKSYFKRAEVAKKQSNLRLILIIAFLLFVSYVLLFR
jgi:hypothetical protein